MIIIYLLSQNKCYIENVNNNMTPEENFQRHVDGNGGTITQLYRPIMILDYIYFDEVDEVDDVDNFNIIINKYRLLYGFSNVFFN